jgi:hypothetical protein
LVHPFDQAIGIELLEVLTAADAVHSQHRTVLTFTMSAQSL